MNVAGLDRVDGRDKVTGRARYAVEHDVGRVAYAVAVQSTIARGEIRGVDAAGALAEPGVLAVLSCENAPHLEAGDDGELALFQSRRVAYRGQIVAAVVAETLEAAREAAALVRVDYDEEPHRVELRADDPGLYRPELVNPQNEPDTDDGDVVGALATAEVVVDAVYETPALHNNPMEPHAATAVWNDGTLTAYDSSQGVTSVRKALAHLFRLDAADVRVLSPHVGGGFGSKGTPRPHVVLAAMAARAVGRPVRAPLTRQQLFSATGYRTPTIQRVRLGAGRDGRLTAIAHDAIEQTSHVHEFAEQTALLTRMLYAAPNRRTTHRLARLDVPTPSWMRAPGECPGSFALESAMDELAIACGLDPIELRIRNEPDRDSETGLPFSSRNLVACLREGAQRFGWDGRDPAPRSRREGRALVGTGVASSTYPARRRASQARVREEGGRYVVELAAADVGTGARTALTRLAAEALDVTPAHVGVELGDTALPTAPIAGGSMGTASWGAAVVEACRSLRATGASEAHADTEDEVEGDDAYARHSFGAQFAEVRVDVDTGEVRVPRLLGVFAAGRIVEPKLARSQLVGGMTMGLGMALMEESVLDARLGDWVTRDLATYHVPVSPDVPQIEAFWLEEEDTRVNPIGVKGIGEIGIVGTAAAVANAVHHATGVRIRDLPIRLDKLVGRL
jgi:xanthine dehydrogenase YagR molybdenum-binding subunit